jgi:hypothetical protein
LVTSRSSYTANVFVGSGQTFNKMISLQLTITDKATLPLFVTDNLRINLKV